MRLYYQHNMHQTRKLWFKFNSFWNPSAALSIGNYTCFGAFWCYHQAQALIQAMQIS